MRCSQIERGLALSIVLLLAASAQDLPLCTLKLKSNNGQAVDISESSIQCFANQDPAVGLDIYLGSGLADLPGIGEW